MKLTELEPGKTYWYSTRNDWAKYDRRAYDRYPVRVESLDRYSYRPPQYSTPKGWTPDKSARLNPKGRYIRVIIPGHPEAEYPSQREDRVAYVEPRYIRMEVEEHRALVEKTRAAEQAERDRLAARRQSGYDLRDQLRARAEGLGLNMRIDLSRLDRPVASVGAEDLAAILARLEAAERAAQ